MNKQFLIGGVIGGVLVWLLLKKKCPKCGDGSPKVLIQTPIPPPPAPPAPPAPTPPQTPVLPTPPSDIKTLPVLDKPVGGQTAMAFTGNWGQWVKY